MFTYIARRAVGTIPVIVLISLLVFMLVQAAPGDPADLLLSDEASKEDVDEARKRWGLDQPVYVQYGKFFIAAIQGDLGTSFRYADPVLLMILERLPATIELSVVSILIAVIFGVPLGVWAGAKPNSWADTFGSLFGFFGISMPNFWMGPNQCSCAHLRVLKLTYLRRSKVSPRSMIASNSLARIYGKRISS